MRTFEAIPNPAVTQPALSYQPALAILDGPPAPLGLVPLVEVDVVARLLNDRRNPNTKRAYAAYLREFFHVEGALPGPPSPEIVQAFLCLPVPQIALALADYKASLLNRSLAEASVNPRLAALKSLLKLAYRLGLCLTDGRSLVDAEKVKSYRDTRGIDVKKIKLLLKAPAKLHGAVKGQKGAVVPVGVRALRDTAMLRLLCENALRRAEVCALNVGDFSVEQSCLWIQGKGRGTQKERVTISGATAETLIAYLVAAGAGPLRGQEADKGPLFLNLDRNPNSRGGRLTVDGLYHLIGLYGRAIGVPDLTPHKLRHSAITAFLDASGGNVRTAQRLSRHAKLDTLTIYDDNRTDLQGEATHLLSGLFR